MLDPNLLDDILVPLSYGILFTYHAFLYCRYKKCPNRTVMGVNNQLRYYWVKSIRDGKLGILAVQTLRNNIMASSLLASTAIILSSIVATYSTDSEKLTSLESVVYGRKGMLYLMIKLVVLLKCFLSAFFMYLQAIRYFNHVSVLINVPNDAASCMNSRFIHAILIRAANYHTMGTRCYFFAFPTMMWLFGPIPLAVTTFLFLPVMVAMDRAVVSGIEHQESELTFN